MKLFNTLTQTVEPFRPQDNLVKAYVCGITPYDTTHLGHAFLYTIFDTLFRYLNFKGYDVRYVQNVTDIDDDVLRKAKELGVSWIDLGRSETARFLNDMDSLNIARPAVYAKATEEIPAVIMIVESLLERGLAYVSEGCVFYSVQSDPDFGGLARAVGLETYEAMLAVANERGNFPNDPRKRDALDFVLWQAQAPGEPAWESPWGPGRPGWHIECSAMVMRYLGPQIDIHGGGYDLTFPHHTCEIAQSEHSSGQAPFARTWMHVAMVRQDGEKMSKSLGNLTLIRNLLKEYTADTIRLMLISFHYRTSWEYDPTDLARSAQTIELLQSMKPLAEEQPAGEDLVLREAFSAAMDEDLNIPAAITLLTEAAVAAQDEKKPATAAEAIRLAQVLGLRLN